MEKLNKATVINVAIITLTIYLAITGLGALFTCFPLFENMSLTGGMAFAYLSAFGFLALDVAIIIVSYFSTKDYMKVLTLVVNIIVALALMAGFIYSITMGFKADYTSFAVATVVIIINTILLYYLDRKTIKDLLAEEAPKKEENLK